MRYSDFLKKSHGCPFCEKDAFDPMVLVKQNRRAMVTVAKAPYVSDQFLVIPRRHVTNLFQLNLLELFDCLRILQWISRQIHKKGHSGYNLVLRDGEGVGRSIAHMHIHVIPDLDLAIKNGSSNRRMLTPLQIERLVKRFQK